MWQDFKDRAKIWWRRYWIWVIFGILLSINLAIAYTHFLRPRELPPAVVPPQTQDQAPEGEVRSIFTGLYIKEEAARNLPLAAMIDNFYSARPTTGLNKADLVFETLVEGGVTRLLAVWQTNEDVEIGAVRSARHYFLPWVEGVRAMYIHSGGSAQALQALKANKDIMDADEFRNGGYYYRVNGIAAPHDLFTTTQRLYTLASKLNSTAAPAEPMWKFSEEEPVGQTAQTVTLDFSLTPYKVRWSYNKDTEYYQRVVGNTIDEDRRTKEQLTTKNIVVLKTTVRPDLKSPQPDAVVVETVGAGEAVLFREGLAVAGRWRKTSSTSPLELIDEAGAPLKLAPGRSWIEVISESKTKALSFE